MCFIGSHFAAAPYVSSAEVFGEFQTLSLIVGFDFASVKLIGQGFHLFVNEATDDLTVFEDKGGLVAADL